MDFFLIICKSLLMENVDRMEQKDAQIEQAKPEQVQERTTWPLLARTGRLVEIDLSKSGETRRGVIASISQGQILVSVGAKISEGIISGREYD